jgi:hypothetical protein
VAKKNPILSDHKLVQKKLQPPFFHAFQGWNTQFTETPYLYKVLPEILWQSFLNKKYGVYVASTITLELLKHIQTIRNVEDGKLFCFISNYETLTDNQTDKILGKLFLNENYKMLIEGILPFIRVFPECPLSKLIYNPLAEHTVKDIELVKEVLNQLLNKTSVHSTHMLSNIFYYIFEMGALKVKKDSPLLKLNEIEYYPDSEQSQITASAMRAGINPFVTGETFLKQNSEWQKYFWNQAYKLEPNNIDNLYC